MSLPPSFFSLSLSLLILFTSSISFSRRFSRFRSHFLVSLFFFTFSLSTFTFSHIFIHFSLGSLFLPLILLFPLSRFLVFFSIFSMVVVFVF